MMLTHYFHNKIYFFITINTEIQPESQCSSEAVRKILYLFKSITRLFLKRHPNETFSDFMRMSIHFIKFKCYIINDKLTSVNGVCYL